MIKVKELFKSFGKTDVLRGIDFELEPQQHCVIQGASGSGKSTFLHLLGGLDSADQGSIEIFGKRLDKMDQEGLAHYRNQVVGFIFQFHFLLPSMNCMENIMLPSQIAGMESKELKTIKDRVWNLAQRLQIENLLNKYPFQLSGGEQQRVNLLRAVSLSPPLLLCDEPTGNLDSHNSAKVVELLGEVAAISESTLIIVTHDEKIADYFPKKVLMRDGKMI